MELAAQRLTQTIGYIGAGTVEYLFNAATNKYYFLELNPRLQVGKGIWTSGYFVSCLVIKGRDHARTGCYTRTVVPHKRSDVQPATRWPRWSTP